MAINYSLNIGSVKKRLTEGEFSNVIVEASFGVTVNSDAVTEVTGQDEEGNDIIAITTPAFSYSCGGTKTFDVSSLDAETFVPFEDITTETIKDWLLASEEVTTTEEFSYVQSSIENVQTRINEYAVETPTTLPGGAISGSVTPSALDA